MRKQSFAEFSAMNCNFSKVFISAGGAVVTIGFIFFRTRKFSCVKLHNVWNVFSVSNVKIVNLSLKGEKMCAYFKG